MDLLKKIQNQAFQNIEVSMSKSRDVTGWMSPCFIDNFKIALQYCKKPVINIIEVGSWKGLSANIMAQHCRQNNQQVRIICIDTWLGSVEHQDEINRTNGYPDIYTEFIQNTKYLSNEDVIYPFPISSTEGACYLKNKGMKADIIYIDAGHEYDSVLSDTKLFWELLEPTGVMIFDDYAWSSVKKAVDEFFEDKPVIKIINQEQAIVFPKESQPNSQPQ